MDTSPTLTNFELVPFKGSILSHLTNNKLIIEILKELEKIPEIHSLKLDPELTTYVSNIICNTIDKKDKTIDRNEICITILTRLYGLNTSEIDFLKKQISFLENNKLIKKVSKSKIYGHSFYKWVKKKIL
jgi:hypothetical protein